jgi:hypothetical protein
VSSAWRPARRWLWPRRKRWAGKIATATNMSADDSADDLIRSIEEYMDEERRKSRPDPRIVVFCDQHLGVRMVRAQSWGLGQYDEAKADANPLDFWRCSKSGCNRCYEPMMFGYFWFSGAMGSRIEPNQNEQRHGNHLERPFMYIGKVGQGRKYLCPFYKCDEQGDDVAAVVVDEEVEISEDPLDRLGKEERKRAVEMAFFQSFASASGLAMDEGSPLNHPPDAPDINCTISGKPHWFELGRIINRELAEKINPKRRTSVSGFSFSQEDPFVEMITKKKSKKYVTGGDPVDLILHFDLSLGDRSVVERQIEKHTELLESLVTTGPFSRVWIYDAWKKRVIWSLSRS